MPPQSYFYILLIVYSLLVIILKSIAQVHYLLNDCLKIIEPFPSLIIHFSIRCIYDLFARFLIIVFDYRPTNGHRANRENY